MEKIKIAAVVVTYNRSRLLIKCLDAIVKQSLLPDEIFIIDNHSDDDTQEQLRNNRFIGNELTIDNEFGKLTKSMYSQSKEAIKISYLFKNVNDGGAGGFFAGMKMAYDAGYNWIWMMDDDGVPETCQLRALLTKSTENDLKYTNALVVNEKNHHELAFSLPLGNKVSAYSDFDVFYDEINPFNGTFIHRDIIDSVGFIKKELFIWGDETEFTLRVKSNGFKIATVCHAVHYHPAKHFDTKYTIPFFKRYRCVMARKPIYFRNYGYIFWKYSKGKFVKHVANYTLAYGLRLQLKNLARFYKFTFRGVSEDWRQIK